MLAVIWALSWGPVQNTYTHFSMWLLGLIGCVPRANIQTQREGGNKGGKESGSKDVLPFMT